MASAHPAAAMAALSPGSCIRPVAGTMRRSASRQGPSRPATPGAANTFSPKKPHDLPLSPPCCVVKTANRSCVAAPRAEAAGCGASAFFHAGWAGTDPPKRRSSE